MADYNYSKQPLLGSLAADSSAIFVCDLQEKFRDAIIYFPEIITTAKKLLSASKILDIPVIVTEQYPKGLGSTVSELDIQHAKVVAAKTKFSMVVPEVTDTLENKLAHVKTIILFGIEAHICIEQTAMDLLSRGFSVHVIVDATSSRTQQDRFVAFQRLRHMGCVMTTSESVLFKLVGDKNHPKFTEIRDLVKTPSPNSDIVFSKM